MGPAPLSCSPHGAVAQLDFAQRDGAAVAELAGPVAELVAAVTGGIGLHAVDEQVATQHICQNCAFRTRRIRGQTELGGEVGRPADECWRRDRRGFDQRVRGVRYLAAAVLGDRVARERVDESGPPAEAIEAGSDRR